MTTPDEFDLLVAEATALNEHVQADPVWTPRPGQAAAPAGDRPGDHYNRAAAWPDVLGGTGAACWGGAGKLLVRRPGKDRGLSATAGYCSNEQSGDLLYVFSTSWPPFEAERAYSKFSAYALLHHGGDFHAAAETLAAQGYGKPAATVRVTGFGNRKPDYLPVSDSLHSPGDSGESETGSETGSESGPTPDRLFRWSSELTLRAKSDKWLWHGFINRGGITLLSALWKAGKTTLLAHMLRAFAAGGEFCGFEIKPAKVLVVSEEDEQTWAERRDRLGLGDHLGFVCRYFVGRPNAAQWLTFLARVVHEAKTHGFDLVVIDTLAKLWPVQKENDASQVDNALMPLWSLTEAGIGVLLIHHLRKSDGEEMTASRGSGALSAFVETIVELRRYDGSARGDARRVLNSSGRYQETPDEVVVELTDNGYVAKGDRTSEREKEILNGLREALSGGEWMTLDEIADAWPGDETPRVNVLSETLQDNTAWFDSKGRGVRNDPLRFRLKGSANSLPDSLPVSDSSHTVGARSESETGSESGSESWPPDLVGRILHVLPPIEAAAASVEAIFDALQARGWGAREIDVRHVLRNNKLAHLGVRSAGAGRKGDPVRYWREPPAAAGTPQRGGVPMASLAAAVLAYLSREGVSRADAVASGLGEPVEGVQLLLDALSARGGVRRIDHDGGAVVYAADRDPTEAEILEQKDIGLCAAIDCLTAAGRVVTDRLLVAELRQDPDEFEATLTRLVGRGWVSVGPQSASGRAIATNAKE